ncbi:hypothetical protein GIB67_028352, partial [Kingdonia uniflora]
MEGGSQLLKWTGIQNRNLAKAWVHISKDKIKSNNQQLDVFWDSALDAFHDFCQQDGEQAERSVSSSKNHWSNMNRAYKVYGTCLKNVMKGPRSGMHQGNLDDAVKTIYEARGKDTLARNVRIKQTSNSSPGMSTPATPNTDSPVLVTDEETECPS